MTRGRRWLATAGMAIACLAASAAPAIGSPLQSVPQPVQRVTPTEPGPLERIAVQPSLDVPAPRRAAHVAPDWPPGVAGRVRYRVHLVVDASGDVAEARVVSGTAAADGAVSVASELNAVLAAVRQWRFEPPAQSPMLLMTYVGTGDAEGIVMPSPTERRPIRIGGGMRPPTKVHHVNPGYPADARNLGLSGVVILEATIDPEGAVSGVQIVRSVTGLDEAAIAAVRQWRYTPTWLDGEPVPVIMTVTVNFQP